MIHTVTENRISASLQSTSKNEVLRELAGNLHKGCSACPTEEIIYQVLLEREKIGSTGIGEGIAIPHGKVENLEHIEIFFGRSINGVPFEATDSKPVHLFFLLLSPTNASTSYLKTLAQVARFLKSPHTRSRLLHAANGREIADIFSSSSSNGG